MGLRISAADMDGTSSCDSSRGDSAALSDALVSVGLAGRGGTGSFVSKDGLILTNWHVAYDAVRQASLGSDKDYITNGFVSQGRAEEVPTSNYEVWITKSCVDVSDPVLEVISKHANDTPLERANRIRDVLQDIAQTAQAKANASGVRCDVQEMLPNESYVLFTYERIQDVRIVYVPPKSLGNFGGDTDNFEWPRHTADFTLLRAYVSPSGQAAEYATENVPYQPKVSLKIQPKGVQPDDFVCLLGFPGRTMRYAPTCRLQYTHDVAVPKMISDFARKLQLIAQYETDSPEAALKLGNSKKGLANELKRSRGKLLMMQKLNLLQERQTEEEDLCNQTKQAQPVLDQLAQVYKELTVMEDLATPLEAFRGIYAGSALLAVGHALHEYLAHEQLRPDAQREATYRKRNLPFLARRLSKRLTDIHIPHETALLRDALHSFTTSQPLQSLHDPITQTLPSDQLESQVRTSILHDFTNSEQLENLLVQEDHSLEWQDTIGKDPFVQCAKLLWNIYDDNRNRYKALLTERDALFAQLLQLQRDVSKETMYPDCNGSLRLSAGHVEGYQAQDALYCQPQTTLAGLYDKVMEAQLGADENLKMEYSCPDKLCDLLQKDQKSREVPVCLLYSTDTVGGNSGSPVLNAYGELVGINFDRQRQGLMNEFQFSLHYSRSIGVDIRYMTWLIGTYNHATHILQELLS